MGGGPGLSESSLEVQSFCWFCLDAAHFSQFAKVRVTDLCFSYSCFFLRLLISDDIAVCKRITIVIFTFIQDYL